MTKLESHLKNVCRIMESRKQAWGWIDNIHRQQDLAKTRVSISCAICCLHLHADQPLFNSQRQILPLPKFLTSENWGTEGVSNSFSVTQLVSGPVDIISVFVSVKTRDFSQVEERNLDCVRGGSKHGHIEILHMHIHVKPWYSQGKINWSSMC